jgi:Acetyltransferase (GNAT) domain
LCRHAIYFTLGPVAVQIVRTRAATSTEWSQAFEASERATFFHGPLWSEIWEAYTKGRYRPSPRGVQFSDGRSAILGVTTERVGLGVERHHLSPAACYGGWVSTDALTREHAEALAQEILRLRGHVWRRSPADHEDGLVVATARNDFTHVIDLREGVEAARGRWKPSASQKVRRAARSGTIVRLASKADDWRAYDALYRLALARWEAPSSVYERSLFTLLHELNSPRVRLWLAECDGRAVSGLVVFHSHRHAVEWHGASAGQDRVGASNLLRWELIELLAAEGFHTYDLNPSGGHSGVVSFKESLGAVPMHAPIVLHPPRLVETVAGRTKRWKKRLRRRPRRS